MFTDCEHIPCMIESVGALIDELGGTGAVAVLTGFGSSAVSNWRSRGRIPAELYLVFAGALRGKNKTADPALFGMTAEARA